MNVKAGDVVQLKTDFKSAMFSGCMVTVSEVKPWGIQGYVQALGTDGEPGGQAYIRARYDDFEFVGTANWVTGSIST